MKNGSIIIIDKTKKHKILTTNFNNSNFFFKIFKIRIKGKKIIACSFINIAKVINNQEKVNLFLTAKTNDNKTKNVKIEST